MATKKKKPVTKAAKKPSKKAPKKAAKKALVSKRTSKSSKARSSAVATDAQVLEALDARFSNFDVERAKRAYIPILEACYAFAKGDENPAMPNGYKIVAKIRTTSAEAPATMRLSAAARESLKNDFEAVGIGNGVEEGISNPENFGFVVRETATNALIVSIRGTQTPAEWVKNFTVIPQIFNAAPEFGLVHLGFEQMWNKIRPDVVAALQGEPADTRITFLGHSLGGAMATLGTVDIKKNLKRPAVDLCTVGSPRVGKIIFRVKFDKLIQDYFRVVEARDIVPHVPSKLTLWIHVGREVEVHSKEDNPHSLKSYLEGLKGLDTQELPSTPLEAVRGHGVLTIVSD